MIDNKNKFLKKFLFVTVILARAITNSNIKNMSGQHIYILKYHINTAYTCFKTNKFVTSR